jgi:Uncharacterized protein conserved in bacteria (DUF2188)
MFFGKDRKMGKTPVWTVSHDDGWANRTEGSQRVSRVFDTQAEAIDAGRAQAQRSGTEHIIQGANGQIRERNSYGADPYPPAG